MASVAAVGVSRSRFPGSEAKLRQLPQRAPTSGFQSACSRPHSLTDLKLRRPACANVTVKLAVIGEGRRQVKEREREREASGEANGERKGNERGRQRRGAASGWRIFQARRDRGNPRRSEEENGRGGGTDTTTYIQAIVLRTVYPARLRHRSAQPQCRDWISGRDAATRRRLLPDTTRAANSRCLLYRSAPPLTTYADDEVAVERLASLSRNSRSDPLESFPLYSGTPCFFHPGRLLWLCPLTRATR